MSFITVENVKILKNPSKFLDEFHFEITFECIAPGIQHELEWKLVYVGSAEDEKYDQELDAVMVGPVGIGKNKFVFTAPAPDHTKIPVEDLLDVTVILLTCSYQEHEFIRIGYYINNEMELSAEQQQQIKALHDAAEQSNTPVEESAIDAIRGPIKVEKIWRNILEDKPRVTRFNIPWDKPEQFPELTDEEKQKLEASASMEADDKAHDASEHKEQQHIHQQNGIIISSAAGFPSLANAESKEQDEDGMDEDEDMDEDDEEEDNEGEDDEEEDEDLGSEDTDADVEGGGEDEGEQLTEQAANTPNTNTHTQ